VSRYWSYDGDTVETHDTAAKAQAHAQAGLDSYRDDAWEGWAEEVECIMWGRVVEQVVETSREEVNEDGDCVVDYSLVPVSEETP